jgi:hypothetical protein
MISSDVMRFELAVIRKLGTNPRTSAHILSNVQSVTFETDSDPDERETLSFSGKIVDMSPTLFSELRTSGIDIGFRGRRYDLSSLEPDGVFTLTPVPSRKG